MESNQNDLVQRIKYDVWRMIVQHFSRDDHFIEVAGRCPDRLVYHALKVAQSTHRQPVYGNKNNSSFYL